MDETRPSRPPQIAKQSEQARPIQQQQQPPRNDMNETRPSRPPSQMQQSQQQSRPSENQQHVRPHHRSNVSSEHKRQVHAQQLTGRDESTINPSSPPPPPPPPQMVISETVQKSNGEENTIDHRRSDAKREPREFKRPSIMCSIDMDNDSLTKWKGALANTMRVDHMVIHYGGQGSQTDASSSASASVPTTTTTITAATMTGNGVIDMASFVLNDWKRQVDTLALHPAEQVAFYKRQYDRLTSVLRVSLFNDAAAAAAAADRPSSQFAIKEAANNADEEQKQQKRVTAAAGKQQNISSSNPNNEFIIVEHKEKENTYPCKSILSVENYVRRIKIPRYIHVKRLFFKDNEKPNLIQILRNQDPNFVVGNNSIYFKGDLAGLCKILKRKLNDIPFTSQPEIKYVEVNETDGGQPPRKKVKIVSSEKQTTENRPVIAAEGIHTDVEEDDENNEGENEEGKKETTKDDDNTSGSDSESGSGTSISGSGSDDEEDAISDEEKKLKSSKEYVPSGQKEIVNTLHYTPTPKPPRTSTPVPMDVERQKSLSPLFPDSAVVGKKRKHR